MAHTIPGPSPLFCSFMFLYSVSSSGRTARTDRALGRGSEVTSIPQTSGPEGAEREEEETGSLKRAGGE